MENLNREWGLTYWSHRLSTWADLWKPEGNVPGGAVATRWAEGLAVEDADALAEYDHPHFGRWPAVTTRRHGAGRVTCAGTVPGRGLARALAAWLAPSPRSGWQDRRTRSSSPRAPPPRSARPCRSQLELAAGHRPGPGGPDRRPGRQRDPGRNARAARYLGCPRPRRRTGACRTGPVTPAPSERRNRATGARPKRGPASGGVRGTGHRWRGGRRCRWPQPFPRSRSRRCPCCPSG